MALNKNIDLGEQIFTAADIIAQKRIEKITFDTTVEAIIVDDKKAQDGIYTVEINGVKTLAYSSSGINYKENDIVMVTIPQGNYNNQKIIIGKKVLNEKESAIPYQSPFSNFINITGDLINNKKEIGIVANSGDEYGWNEGIDFQDIITERNPIANIKLNALERNFSYIGIKADFYTALDVYNTITGNYGLILALSFQDKESKEEFLRIKTIDSDDFFGNIYNFKIYQTQEIIFDISDFKDCDLKELTLYAYQRNNFKNINNNLIYTIEDSVKEPNNIIIKNYQIFLGELTDNFNENLVKIVTNNNLTYSSQKKDEYFNFLKSYNQIDYTLSTFKTKLETDYLDFDQGLIEILNNPVVLDYTEEQIKEIINNYINNYSFNINVELNLLWVHQNEKTNEIEVITNDIIPIDYTVQWYKYQIGAQNDNFSGRDWEKLENYNNTLNIETSLNINRREEKFKVIILKKENNITFPIAKTDEIVFTNLDQLSAAAVIEELDQRFNNDLIIDFSDSSSGNYYIYEKTGEIQDEYKNEEHYLIPRFLDRNSDSFTSLELSPGDSITWRIPNINTMLKGYQKGNFYEESLEENYQIFTKIIDDEDNEKDFFIYYKIKNNLNYNNDNNRIYLDIIKDGIQYRTSILMNFDTYGTSGTEYTLKIDWDNNENVFDIGLGELNGIVSLSKGKEQIEINNDDLQYKWYKIKSDKTGIKTNKNEEKGTIFHPLHLYHGSFEPLSNFSPKYWTSESEEAINHQISDVAIYNLETNSFEIIGDTNIYTPPQKNSKEKKLLYCKANKESLPLLKFKPIKNVLVVDDSRSGTYDEETSTYYYSNIKKVYIKWNDTYIIDPYDQYYDNITYYIPDYADEKDYGGNNALQIIKENNGHFQIKSPNDQNQQPTMKELYILEVQLNNFGNYPLILRTPIAFKNSDNHTNPYFKVTGIQGPTTVRYNSSGETSFDRNNYGISFEILKNNNYKTYTQGYYNEENSYIYSGLYGHWELLYENSLEEDLDLLPQIEEKYKPSLSSQDNQFLLDLINNNDLKYLIYILFMSQNIADYDYQNAGEAREKRFNDLIKQFSNGFKGFFKSSDESRKQGKNYYKRTLKESAEPKGYQYTLTSNTPQSGLYEYTTLSDIFSKIEDIKEHIENLDSHSGENNIISECDTILEENKVNLNELLKIKICNQWLIKGFKIPALNPLKTYFKNTPLYGMSFIIDEAILDDNGEERVAANTALWTQPIYIYQDNYPSRLLDSWSGELILDDKTSMIQAKGFSAGKKENGTFSGVIIGDWSNTSTEKCIAEHTGIYGLHEGAMSYAFKDDGTGFIGKDGRGRIYFDGNSSQIFSANWIKSSLNTGNMRYLQDSKGMFLDIDDGILNLKGNLDSQIYMSSNSFKISCENTDFRGIVDLIELNVPSDNKNDIRWFLRTSNFREKTSNTPLAGMEWNLKNNTLIADSMNWQISNPSYGSVSSDYYKMKIEVQSLPSQVEPLIQLGNGTNNLIKMYDNGKIECQELLIKNNLLVNLTSPLTDHWRKYFDNEPTELLKFDIESQRLRVSDYIYTTTIETNLLWVYYLRIKKTGASEYGQIKTETLNVRKGNDDGWIERTFLVLE